MHQGSPESEKLKASLLKFSQLLKINFGPIDEEEDRGPSFNAASSVAVEVQAGNKPPHLPFVRLLLLLLLVGR